jgi:ferredoxin
MSVTILSENCIACGACAVICTNGAIYLQHGKALIHRDLCTNCLRCVTKCYMRAIHANSCFTPLTKKESAHCL